MYTEEDQIFGPRLIVRKNIEGFDLEYSFKLGVHLSFSVQLSTGRELANRLPCGLGKLCEAGGGGMGRVRGKASLLAGQPKIYKTFFNELTVILAGMKEIKSTKRYYTHSTIGGVVLTNSR